MAARRHQPFQDGKGGNRISGRDLRAVSAFEMATMHRAGKWPEVRRLLDTFQRAMERENFILLEVKVDHSILGGLMDGAHRDPFDRLLAAQAKVEDLVLVTRDPAFAGFDTETLR